MLKLAVTPLTRSRRTPIFVAVAAVHTAATVVRDDAAAAAAVGDDPAAVAPAAAPISLYSSIHLSFAFAIFW